MTPIEAKHDELLDEFELSFAKKDGSDDYKLGYLRGFDLGVEMARKEFLDWLKDSIHTFITWNNNKLVLDDKYVLFSGDVQDHLREEYARIKQSLNSQDERASFNTLKSKSNKRDGSPDTRKGKEAKA